jgi:hypothetical protein
MIEKEAGDGETEVNVAPVISDHGAVREVEQEAGVVGLNADRPADSIADARAERHQRLKPRLHVSQEVRAGTRPRCLLCGDAWRHVFCVRAQVRLLISKDALHRQFALQMLHIKLPTRIERPDAPWEH